MMNINGLELSFYGSINSYTEMSGARHIDYNIKVEDAVRDIIRNVRERGDDALVEYSKKFDGVEISGAKNGGMNGADAVGADTGKAGTNKVGTGAGAHSTDNCAPGGFAVPGAEIGAAYEHVKSTEPELINAMERAADNIRAYHKRQIREGYIITDDRDGVILGQRVIPIESVGLYIPGGTAVYPSTLLMNAIPAKLAGVTNLYLASPPQSDGHCAVQILAAAKIAGVNRVFRVGGAQAIAAFAFGTQSIPRVDKITGPGNTYVASAKRQLYGYVGIDMVAGPSEILIIADSGADARYLAADMLSQAEHDENAWARLFTTSEELMGNVAAELTRQLDGLSRRKTARASLLSRGVICKVDSVFEAIDIANALAPEHLELCVKDPFAYIGQIKNAGSVFLGNYTTESLGDYFSGTNHTLPTNGTARFLSPLSVDDFVKKSSFTYYTKEALSREYGDIARFARSEGLTAHARSAEIRFDI